MHCSPYGNLRCIKVNKLSVYNLSTIPRIWCCPQTPILIVGVASRPADRTISYNKMRTSVLRKGAVYLEYFGYKNCADVEYIADIMEVLVWSSENLSLLVAFDTWITTLIRLFCFQLTKMVKMLLLVGMALLYASAMKFSGLGDCKVCYLKIDVISLKVRSTFTLKWRVSTLKL